MPKSLQGTWKKNIPFAPCSFLVASSEKISTFLPQIGLVLNFPAEHTLSKTLMVSTQTFRTLQGNDSAMQVFLKRLA